MKISIKKVSIALIIIFLFSITTNGILMVIALKHNPQGEFCDYKAYKSSLPKEGRSHFIELNGKYQLVEKSSIESGKEYYIEYLGKNIHDANITLSDSLCRLTPKFYSLFFKMYPNVIVLPILLIVMIIAFFIRHRNLNKGV